MARVCLFPCIILYRYHLLCARIIYRIFSFELNTTKRQCFVCLMAIVFHLFRFLLCVLLFFLFFLGKYALNKLFSLWNEHAIKININMPKVLAAEACSYLNDVNNRLQK